MSGTTLDVSPMAEARPRLRGRFEGEVRRMRVQPRAGVRTLELELTDGSGHLTVLFMGRKRIPGIECGTRLAIEGTPVATRDGLMLYNPAYELR